MPDYPEQLPSRRRRLRTAIGEAKAFQLCSPSDDPELQTGKTIDYRRILTQIQRLASPLLSPADADQLNSLSVDFDDIYSVYDAWAMMEAMLPDIEMALEAAADDELEPVVQMSIVEPSLIEAFDSQQSAAIDCVFVARVCREINSCYSQGHNIAALLLMRTILNAVPPVFGHETFPQLVAASGKSLKGSYQYLEDGLRKVADFHAHSMVGRVRSYPTAAQVEPFKPQFELLLQQVLAVATPG